MIVEAFLGAEPAGGRHAERVKMINALDDDSLDLDALYQMGPAAHSGVKVETGRPRAAAVRDVVVRKRVRAAAWPARVGERSGRARR